MDVILRNRRWDSIDELLKLVRSYYRETSLVCLSPSGSVEEEEIA